MPCEQSADLAFLDGFHHLVEHGSPRFLGRLRFDVFTYDRQRLLPRILPELVKLRVDGQNLSALIVR